MLRDLRIGARVLARAPFFTMAATLALALAIGANGAIFGLVDALWFRPPGVRDPGTIVRVFATTQTQTDGGWSWPEYEDLRGVAAFEGVAVRGRRGAVLTSPDGSQELLLVNVISENFFDLLGVRPAFGRLIAPSEETTTAPGVVLGHDFWKSRFGGDPSVVGERLQLGRGNPTTVTVLGVLPRGFRDLEAAADRDLWMSTSVWLQLGRERQEFESRDSRWFDVIARRKADAGVATATQQVQAVAAALGRTHGGESSGRSARAVSDLDYRLERAGIAARAMLGLVLLLVLITCVNVANLLFARAAARVQEFGVRVAVGASRARLIRQSMAESIILSGLGTAAGLLVASWLIRLLPLLLIPPPGFRSSVIFQIDTRMTLFTAATAAVTTMLVGLLPAIASARTDAMTIVRSSAGASARLGVWRSLLVSCQVAVSLVLLCVAGSLVRSFTATQSNDIGIARDSVLTLWTTSGVDAVTGREGMRRLAALPGVTDVAAAIRAPLSLSGGGLAMTVSVPGAQPDAAALPRVKFNAVTANYFTVMRTRIVRGRSFTADEEGEGGAAVIVSAAFARQYLGQADPLQAALILNGAPHRIVGIAQDAVVGEVGEPPQPYLYVPFWAGRYGEMTFLVAATEPTSGLVLPARDALRSISRDLDPRRSVAMSQYVDYATSMHRTTATLAAILGVIGLVLTAVGVYGLVAFRTTRRTKEIGIRRALGAPATQVVRLVLADGVLLGAIGLAAGLPLALWGTHLAASLLIGVKAWDPLTFSAAAMILFAAIVSASLLPARGALRIDPSTALRR